MHKTENSLSEHETDVASFPHYSRGEVEMTCFLGQAGTLKWRENADGTPHNGIGRIYVSMHNPALDVVVQTDRTDGQGRFSIFPASNWQKGPINQFLSDVMRETIHAVDQEVNAELMHCQRCALQSRKTGNASATRYFEHWAEVASDPLRKMALSLQAVDSISTRAVTRRMNAMGATPDQPFNTLASGSQHDGTLRAKPMEKGPNDRFGR